MTDKSYGLSLKALLLEGAKVFSYLHFGQLLNLLN